MIEEVYSLWFQGDPMVNGLSWYNMRIPRVHTSVLKVLEKGGGEDLGCLSLPYKGPRYPIHRVQLSCYKI